MSGSESRGSSDSLFLTPPRRFPFLTARTSLPANAGCAGPGRLMRVRELTAWQVRIPLTKPIQHASHTRSETDNLVVRCVLADGTEGFGEAVPREYVTGETVGSTLALLQRSHLPAQLEDCTSFAA